MSDVELLPPESPAPVNPPAEAVPQGSESEAPEQVLLRSEVSLGSSPAGMAANEALRALSRAARSFLLYDPKNEAIRTFLAEYRDAMKEALQHGQLELEVRPFELMRGDEPVYLERDRERSLAFRLFRDGVRRLTIEPDVEWVELLRLLEILSVRYTGVRQHEDDVVTLLWKAGFQHIDIVAVEGFVPEEDEDDEDLADARALAIRRAAGHIDVPSDWDTPLERHDEERDYAFKEISDTALQPLRDELSSHALPGVAIRLVTEMLALVGERNDPTTFEDVTALLEEVRLFLLSEGQLGGLLKMVKTLRELREVNPEQVDRELGRFGDARALQRIVHSSSLMADEAPPELTELLDILPGDHLGTLVGLLSEERGASARQMLRQLIERYVARNQDRLLKEIARVEGGVAADLLRAVAGAVPSLRKDLVERCLTRPEPEVQREVRRILEEAEKETFPLRTLHEFLSQAPSEPVRLAVVEKIVIWKDRRSFPLLIEHLDQPKQGRLGPDELSALGRALARLDPNEGLKVLGNWVRPHSWWDRLRGVTGDRSRQWAGVAGLGMLPGEEPETCIRWLAERAGEDMHVHCMKTLHSRRRSGAGQVEGA